MKYKLNNEVWAWNQYDKYWQRGVIVRIIRDKYIVQTVGNSPNLEVTEKDIQEAK